MVLKSGKIIQMKLFLKIQQRKFFHLLIPIHFTLTPKIIRVHKLPLLELFLATVSGSTEFGRMMIFRWPLGLFS